MMRDHASEPHLVEALAEQLHHGLELQRAGFVTLVALRELLGLDHAPGVMAPGQPRGPSAGSFHSSPRSTLKWGGRNRQATGPPTPRPPAPDLAAPSFRQAVGRDGQWDGLPRHGVTAGRDVPDRAAEVDHRADRLALRHCPIPSEKFTGLALNL